jgi:hypothetical protein
VQNYLPYLLADINFIFFYRFGLKRLINFRLAAQTRFNLFFFDKIMENSNSVRRAFSISRSGKFKRRQSQRLSITDQSWDNSENIAVKNEVKVENREN